MGSPLASYVSRAVLNVTQDKARMDAIERKNFLSQTSSCQDGTDQGTIISSDLSHSVYSFGGLFIITGVTSLFALLAELPFSNRHRFYSSSASIRDHHRGPSVLAWSNFIMEILAKKSGNIIVGSVRLSRQNECN
ncbi:hypothetical protein CRG98_037236 [Punica granatum]|nr:hypothetical protein CRG98_037236 [Punica granatum]